MPRFISKFLLIIMIGLFSFHLIFLSSKKLSSPDSDIINATEEQYDNYINAMYDPRKKLRFIAETKTTYLFNLPKEFLNYVYLGYFIASAGLIIISKFEKI